MAVPFPGFPPETLKFLRGLAQNNNRDWFNARKGAFEESVKAPLFDFVTQLGAELEKFAPGLQTDPKKAVYRIYRDTRFSKNKAPYKTHAAAGFVPRGTGKEAAACYYFHFSPSELLIGGGLYAAAPRQLLAIRQQLADRSGEFRKILKARPFQTLFGELQGERLKRAPKGFAPDGPAIDLLLYKQFLAASELDPALVETPRILPETVKRFRAVQPLLDWLNRAIQSA
jgi:uncharacterized protein (TIGR02453 family)